MLAMRNIKIASYDKLLSLRTILVNLVALSEKIPKAIAAEMRLRRQTFRRDKQRHRSLMGNRSCVANDNMTLDKVALRPRKLHFSETANDFVGFMIACYGERQPRMTRTM